MASESTTLYLKADRNVEVSKQNVMLGDLLNMECSDKTILMKVKTLRILKIREEKEQRYVISVLKIIACIHEQYPRLEIQNLGETDIIVTYENQKTPPLLWHILKVVLVSAVIFFGSAFSIMAFNNDVGVTKLFGQIYELIMGKKTDGFSVLEVTYSIGLAIGILIFFNHFGKKRFTVDPTPMEIQMRLYENDIQTTLVENAAPIPLTVKQTQGDVLSLKGHLVFDYEFIQACVDNETIYEIADKYAAEDYYGYFDS